LTGKNANQIPILCFLLITAGLKLLLLAFERVPFNSDEAIVALMARHIVLKSERPIFFYGQAYMGSLDAFLVALGFSVFGMKVEVIRGVQILLYINVIITTVEIARMVFMPSTGKWFTAALLAIPTVNVTLYTTVSLGGYGEALLIGNLILLNGLKVVQHIEDNKISSCARLFTLLGLFIGLGVWANGITLVYAIPTSCGILWIMYVKRKQLRIQPVLLWVGLFFLGCVIGSLPWWIYAAQHGLKQLLAELLGMAVSVEQTSWLVQVGMHLFSLVVLGGTVLLGLRPPWEVRWLALPLAPFVFVFWIGVVWIWWRMVFKSQTKNISLYILTGVVLTLAVGFVFTPFGVDPSGRYFVPIWVILSLIAGEVVTRLECRLVYKVMIVGIVLVFNLWGTVQCAIRYPPGLTTQFDVVTQLDHRYMPALISFLKQQNETRGYTNYWVAYPMAFLSDEEVIFVPRLPYHHDLRYTPRDDRYSAYTELVNTSQRIAYITTNNPALDDYLVKKFKELSMSWQEEYIGDYHIYYNLSQVLHPQDIGLGDLRP